MKNPMVRMMASAVMFIAVAFAAPATATPVVVAADYMPTAEQLALLDSFLSHLGVSLSAGVVIQSGEERTDVVTFYARFRNGNFMWKREEWKALPDGRLWLVEWWFYPTVAFRTERLYEDNLIVFEEMETWSTKDQGVAEKSKDTWSRLARASVKT